MTELIFKVDKDISTVKQYLIDVEKFASVHPIIYKMIDLGGNQYKVFEKIKIGIISYSFTYKATIRHDDNSVNMEASVFGMAKLLMRFTFQKEANATIIKELLTVQSLLPIKNFMVKLIDIQHREMFKNIDNEEK
jgi:carbon monoxide dehydrogenase subunit G